ncbi:hypothetical protein NPIL_140771 [Nephila pilipes]|uniref:Uncharacterized protein n=1 Tax=Nephila pilipes TaxID=299642 RepID=A0A8X6TA74_NEPPI|nr:hypothetical protein NPIL_140771 [Nephila pilipes]
MSRCHHLARATVSWRAVPSLSDPTFLFPSPSKRHNRYWIRKKTRASPSLKGCSILPQPGSGKELGSEGLQVVSEAYPIHTRHDSSQVSRPRSSKSEPQSKVIYDELASNYNFAVYSRIPIIPYDEIQQMQASNL